MHAHSHLRVMGGVKSTKENIQEAIGGETFEFTKMYPQMIEEARRDGNKQAQQSFEFANKVEKIHAELYQKALNSLGKNEAVDYYVCQVCGNTVENAAPDKCPICGASKSMFIKIGNWVIRRLHELKIIPPLARGGIRGCISLTLT